VDNSIAWAFSQPDLNAGEKLVLVWLAWRAGNGAALMQREQLAAVTEYEPRSLQRILKSLRDRGMLHEADGWYSVGQTPGNEAPAFPPAELTANLVRQVAAGVSLISPDELEAAGETIAKHLTEAADGHLTRFNDVSLRLLQGIEKIAQAARVWEESVADAVAPPPPDPVRESTHFRVFMASGFMQEDEAYEIAKKRLEAEGVLTSPAAAGDNARSIRRADTPARAAAAASGTGAKPAGGRSYLDNTLGRFERIRDILDPAGADPWADAMTTWTQLEAAENKHTVEGETSAFELLYPAIVTAARRCAGTMTLAQFLDQKAILQNRAPWDLASGAAGPSDQALQAELGAMLEELERVNHPMAQAPPRTVDGALTEPLAAYHLRVKRVHQQLKMLQEKGI
jgi:hypothetical protein